MQERIGVRSFSNPVTAITIHSVWLTTKDARPDCNHKRPAGPTVIDGSVGNHTHLTLTVAAVTIGTLAYQWEKKNGEFENIAQATAADYTVASWDDTANAGTYRCKITNTLNHDVITVYSNECVATTAVGG